MAFPAFLDTCVLFPAALCDTMLRVAEVHAFRPLWSGDVMAELHRNLVKLDLPAERVDRRIAQMTKSFPDAMVTGYESLIDGMTNDPKDRHVLAAAVRAHAEVIVTFNLKDFPATALEAYDIAAVHPDDFLLDQLDLYPGATLHALRAQAAAHRREPRTVAGVLAMLERSGLRHFAAEVRRHL
ncbi:PIN domain-containing protein [Pseudosporangium ferrugineum]|uniref:PIN domain-containing protein n=1 Tax=Pseudosporangium ferrugineum TaxID=439699 RepID=A0A2T0S7T0_9ACTN|nr:PIN domain-containing protein [Pseudosporangium ferrugineum]PRY29363.1 PIN domain-containing protein [Pseudosporangium ferrugineum]